MKSSERIGNKIFQSIYKTISLALKADKKRFLLSVFLNISLAVISAVSAWYFSVFLNTAIYNSTKIFFNEKIIFAIIIIVLLRFLNTIIFFWDFRVSNIFSRKFMTKAYILRAKASERVDIQTYESSSFSSLKVNIDTYFSKLQGFIDNSIFETISGLAPMIISLGIIIATKNWWLLVFVIAPSLVNFYVQLLDGRSMWQVENNVVQERKYFHSIDEFFSKKSFIQEIKVSGIKDFLINKMENARSVIDSVFSQRDNEFSKRKIFAEFFTHVMEIFVPVFLIYQVFTGGMLVGSFWFINGRFNSFNDNFRKILRMMSRMYKDAPYVYDIFKYLEFQPAIENGTQKIESFEKLEIKNVNFVYPESDRKIINKLNFSVNRGEKVAIIGLNGAGKTTITKLLLRFYLPTKGSVEYNGIKTGDLEKEAFYSKIALLPQDFAKFELTFEEAVALGDIEKGIDIDMVIDSAKKAGIHDFIMSHENGYKTQIGRKYKDGVELSGGQWQKVSIAKMFYSKKDLWILDEPTSAIDADAEAQIFEQLEKLPDNITVIMISHRFSTVRNADRIIVIDKGAVREQGTHEELIALNDEYARLFNLQAEGYK